MILMGEEVYVLPYEKAMDKRLLYSPLRGHMELIEQNDAEIMEENSISLELRELLHRIEDKPLKDLDILQKGFPVLNIDFSNGCNMRCIYCYAGRGEGRVKYQTKKNIDQIISVYFDHVRKLKNYEEDAICHVSFGNDAEPTYKPDLLIYTVEKIKEIANKHHLLPRFSMPTNGAFGKKIRDYIIENFESISLSFDGPEAIQNIQRPLADGRPSYDLVYANARAIYESSVKVGFNIVVTANNVDQLKETIAYFNGHFPGAAVSFSPVTLKGRALQEQGNLVVDEDIFQRRLIEAIAFARDTSVKLGDKNLNSYRLPRRHYCSSTAVPNWNVSLIGDIYACMEAKTEEMKIGLIDLESGDLQLYPRKIDCLQAYTVDSMEKCSDCFAKYLCVGGCKARSEIKTDICEAIRRRCLNMMNVKYEEEQLIKQGRALFKLQEEVKQ